MEEKNVYTNDKKSNKENCNYRTTLRLSTYTLTCDN